MLRRLVFTAGLRPIAHFDFNEVQQAAKDSGYQFFAFNEVIYYIDGTKIFGITIKDLI